MEMDPASAEGGREAADPKNIAGFGSCCLAEKSVSKQRGVQLAHINNLPASM